MQLHSPHNTTRHVLSSYFFTTLLSGGPNPHSFFQRQRARTPTYRPPRNASTLLIPIVRNLHWHLIIRHQGTYYCVDSGGNHHITPNKQQEYDLITASPAHTPSHHNNSALRPLRAFTQRDQINCGVFLLLHAYVFLYHPDPLTYSWANQPTDIATNFRHFILTSLRTNRVPDLFSNHTSITQQNPHTQPTTPTNATKIPTHRRTRPQYYQPHQKPKPKINKKSRRYKQHKQTRQHTRHAKNKNKRG